jgi:hypothetical protein
VRRIPNEGAIPDGVRRRLEPLARLHGVTIERIVEVVRARRKFRRAKFYRRRARRRALERNPSARKFRFQQEPLLAGETELHGLLKAVGLTKAQFCGLVGIDPSVFDRWYANPLHPWPVEFLRYFGWAQRMAQQMREWGKDPEIYKPRLPAAAKAGHYPRTWEQGEQLIAALSTAHTINCPIHGRQIATGPKCPHC